MTDDKQHLDNLLKHPGWHLIEKHAKAEIEGRLNTALANAANTTDDALAISLVRQCVAVRQAIEAFVEWPAARLKVLQDAQVTREGQGQQLSRRGTL